ncbi:hypothetical protein [Paenibacillus sp. SYP-B4298]|uniref:hypothetical protein n=1 Tax=Paenibacillus sp. SYP-B4298 TaxID=2996034 RepID=UPI0022DDC006|nr:hypothetical protein [Paenibacillus sp. SYP-B4298]
MDEKMIGVLIKAWETYQNLSKGFGENAWKIRTMGIGFWAAIVAYGYKQNEVTMYYLAALVAVLFFMLEAGTRILQQKYIQKSIEIEKSINDFLTGDLVKIPGDGISTNFSNPSLKDFISLLKLRRWMFWLPYIVLIATPFFL